LLATGLIGDSANDLGTSYGGLADQRVAIGGDQQHLLKRDRRARGLGQKLHFYGLARTDAGLLAPRLDHSVHSACHSYCVVLPIRSKASAVRRTAVQTHECCRKVRVVRRWSRAQSMPFTKHSLRSVTLVSLGVKPTTRRTHPGCGTMAGPVLWAAL